MPLVFLLATVSY